MGSETAFSIETVHSGAMAIISPLGDPDLMVQSDLGQAVEQALVKRPRVIAIDLRGVTFLDSSGLHVLISAGRRCQQCSRRYFLIRGGLQIDTVLEACGLQDYFEIVAGPDSLSEDAFSF